MFKVNKSGITLESNPSEFITKVRFGNGQVRQFEGVPAIVTKAGGNTIPFDSKCIESKLFKTGVSEGIRTICSGFLFDNEEDKVKFADLKVIIDYEILSDGVVRVCMRTEGEPADGLDCIFMQNIDFGADKDKGYTILPRMQGILFPSKAEHTIRNGDYIGLIYDREAYIPLFGQVYNTDSPFGKGPGYLAIIDTAFDAKYHFVSPAGGDTKITPIFAESLGAINYKRVILYHFEENMDYNRMAEIYREYAIEKGIFVSLNQKIAKNPNVEYLVGSPVIHTGISNYTAPKSHFYDAENPENNDRYTPFGVRADQLKKLHENGLKKAYIHLDGWGLHGYDNLHPDVFPPHQKSGGAPAMRDLANVAKSLGYKFGIHDQYRDYYYDAETFDVNNAVQNRDGSHVYICWWAGGEQTVMCACHSPDYVRRNYNKFKELDIDIQGAYLDVFSIVELDECFNPEHRMTREECAKYRGECFDILTNRGIITSSEEPEDIFMPYISLVHHAPYFVDNLGDVGPMAGFPIPLFNMIFHDCLVTPWFVLGNAWSMPDNYDALGLAYINGGTCYWPIDGANEEESEILNGILKTHEKIATSRMLSFEFLDNSPRKMKSVFATKDGGKLSVTVDFGGDHDKAVIKIDEE